jgi:hypothetical protein
MKGKYLVGLVLVAVIVGTFMVVPALGDYQDRARVQNNEQIGDCACGSECGCEKLQMQQQLMNCSCKQEQNCKCFCSVGECNQNQNNNCNQYQNQKGTEHQNQAKGQQ